MEFTARQIAEILNGTIEGNEEVRVSKLSKIEEGETGSLSFLSNLKYSPFIYSTKASTIIVSNDFVPVKKFETTLVRVKDPYSAFAQLLEVYNQMKAKKPGISTKAHISEDSVLGEKVYIGEFAYIGPGVKIGDNTHIYPFTYIGDNAIVGNNCTFFPGVKVYNDCIIGNNCTMHGGVIIGSDGFGFAPQEDNNYKKIPQTGNVILEDNVEIGSNTTIDRATLGSTIIRKGAKLDNLIQIGHNAEIGENTIIVAQSGISGSTKIGKNCMIGGQVGIVGHISIADNVMVAAQSGIGSSIKEKGKVVQGSPSFGIRDYQKSYIHFRNLNKIITRLEELEKRFKE
ncbi:MAG: UDP-3-O-(3-hydroxymyristoyl)glucosamine N-acyltransferase [Bacteroidales bacterium]|nr:UDP-3-O-(3-hydroxymyristoyl)glucosamine N-acyltransferase [Bacteroidales bacterium]